MEPLPLPLDLRTNTLWAWRWGDEAIRRWSKGRHRNLRGVVRSRSTLEDVLHLPVFLISKSDSDPDSDESWKKNFECQSFHGKFFKCMLITRKKSFLKINSYQQFLQSWLRIIRGRGRCWCCGWPRWQCSIIHVSPTFSVKIEYHSIIKII